jgi:cytidylate kinase
MIIAVDGPTASGKGTVAKHLAERYGLKRLDTGSLYRAVGLAVLDAGGDPGRRSRRAVAAAQALDLAPSMKTAFAPARLGWPPRRWRHPGVRRCCSRPKRDFAADPAGAVLDGRDIGTVICPDADVKLFVTASLDRTHPARSPKELQAPRRDDQISRLSRPKSPNATNAT